MAWGEKKKKEERPDLVLRAILHVVCKYLFWLDSWAVV